MHVEEYITSVGKQHKNERQNYEFHSISSLRKFIEDWEVVNQNLVKPDVSGQLPPEISDEELIRCIEYRLKCERLKR